MEPEVKSSLSSRQGSSQRQTRALLWVGFGGLLLLMGVLGFSAISFLYQIELRQEKIRQDYVERDRTLEKLRSSIFLSGTYVRDFLLGANDTLAASRKTQYFDMRRQVEAGVTDYRRLLQPEERPAFQQLEQELNEYFATVAPVLDWTAAQRQANGYQFVEEQVLPRRMLAIGLADRIQQLSEKQLEASSQALSDLFASFRTKLAILLGLTLLGGVTLAGITLWRLFRLERESAVRFEQILHAQEELKRLSAELLSAQESERRRISRELHDEVGQVLSAMMLGLGNVRSSIEHNHPEEALRQVQLVQDMTERNASVVRNLSLLLRPTMLDDLGLIAALKWLAREVSRTSGVQVDVEAEGAFEDLPEDHRTCVFRVVQEAVHNAVRHAGASTIRVQVALVEPRRLRVSVQDDGKGFDPSVEKGLGILGMEERVVRLGGTLRVDSERGRGTVVSFELPLPERLEPAHPYYEISPLRTA